MTENGFDRNRFLSWPYRCFLFWFLFYIGSLGDCLKIFLQMMLNLWGEWGKEILFPVASPDNTSSTLHIIHFGVILISLVRIKLYADASSYVEFNLQRRIIRLYIHSLFFLSFYPNCPVTHFHIVKKQSLLLQPTISFSMVIRVEI